MEFQQYVLGKTIKTARLEKSLTQEKLAEMVDITPVHLNQLESERRKPSIEVLYKLVRTLNFSVDALFFPENGIGQDMKKKIERNLTNCTKHELKVIHKMIEAMLDKQDE